MNKRVMGIRQPAKLGQGFRLTCLILLLGLVAASAGQPNLTPYQKSGWSDKIVVSRLTGTTIDSSGLTTDDTLYVDWAVINNGNEATAKQFYTALYVDGTLKESWPTDAPLNAGWITWVTDYSIGSLSAGTHTISITTDYTGAIPESNEGDNSYSKTLSISNSRPYIELTGLPDGVPGDEFGYSVALSGDGNTALVGSPMDDPVVGAYDSGSAHVFVRSGGGWIPQGDRQGELVWPGFPIGSQVGYAVALSADGNTALVGHPNLIFDTHRLE